MVQRMCLFSFHAGSLTVICKEINKEWKQKGLKCVCLREWRTAQDVSSEGGDRKGCSSAHMAHNDILTLSLTHERKLHSPFHYSHSPVTRPLWRHTHCSFVIKACSNAYKAAASHTVRFHCSSETLGQG